MGLKDIVSLFTSAITLFLFIVVVALVEMIYTRCKMLPSTKGVTPIEESPSPIRIEDILDELGIPWRRDGAARLLAVCDSERIEVGDCEAMLKNGSAPVGSFRLVEDGYIEALVFSPKEMTREKWLEGASTGGTTVTGDELVDQVREGLSLVRNRALYQQEIRQNASTVTATTNA